MNQVFYFGSRTEPLLGVYHEARQPSLCLGAVICNPVGHEYIRSHAALRRLAERMSEAGIPVLRFDYACTGDSSGESRDGLLQTSTNNIRTARRELVDMTQVQRVALIGLRLGASMAYEVTARDKSEDIVVLWDPIIGGAAYLAELRALQRSLCGAVSTVTGGCEELVGFEMCRNLLGELEGFNLLRTSPVPAMQTGIVLSQETPDFADMLELFRSSGAPLCVEIAPRNNEWQDPRLVGHTLIAGDEIGRIVAMVERFAQ